MNIKLILLCLLLPTSTTLVYSMEKSEYCSNNNLKAEVVYKEYYPIYYPDGKTVLGDLEKQTKWHETDSGVNGIKHTFIIYIHPFEEGNYNFLNRKQMKIALENGELEDLYTFIFNEKNKVQIAS